MVICLHTNIFNCMGFSVHERTVLKKKTDRIMFSFADRIYVLFDISKITMVSTVLTDRDKLM